MAKKITDEGKSKPNSITPEAIKKWLGQFDLLASEDLALHMKYMREKKDNAEERNRLFKMAKAEGVPTKELKALLEERKLREKIKAAREALDIDQRSVFEQMIDALGGEKGLVGLPLAAAPIEKAKAEDDFEKVGRENAEKLAGGIKQKNNGGAEAAAH